jgi:DNA-binding beta-propeller fold protein YncE
MRRHRGLLVLALATAIGLAGASGADARVGALSQLPGKAGCVAQQDAPKAVRKDCTIARFGGHQMWGTAVSPDGRNLYVASIGGAVSVLSIRHGQLHQLPGKAGCLSGTGKFGCRRVPQVHLSLDIAVSPDGRSVYLGSADPSGVYGGVVAFARDRRTGALRKIGCIGENGRGGCAPARSVLQSVRKLAVSPDGRSVYVGSNDAHPLAPQAGAVAVFARGHRGGLTQLPGAQGCVNRDGSDGCSPARALSPECCGVAVSPDSRSVYVSSSLFSSVPGHPEADSARFALSAFSRAPGGGLTQLAGTSGCMNRDGSDGCSAVALKGDQPENEAGSVLVSPDGRSVYLAHSSTFPESETDVCGGSYNFIALFPRGPSGALGGLLQDQPSCGGYPLVSPDGSSVYAVTGNFGNVLTGFSRNPHTGLLSQAGCLGHDAKACREVRHVSAPSSMAITPDGRYAYVVSDDTVSGETIGVFRRSVR